MVLQLCYVACMKSETFIVTFHYGKKLTATMHKIVPEDGNAVILMLQEVVDGLHAPKKKKK